MRPAAGPFSAAIGWNSIFGRTSADAASGRGPTHSSIAAVRRQPASSGPGPADDHTQQPTSDGTRDKGSATKVDGNARVEELQQAVKMELGERLTHVPAGLGHLLAEETWLELRGRVRGLKEAIGREDAAALLQSHARLVVRVHPSEVQVRLDALAAAFETDRKAVVRLCSRTKSAGSILEMHPHKTQQRVEALCSTMQLGPQKLLELCGKYTFVLAVEPDIVLARAAALRDGLGLELDRSQVAQLCYRCPNCLMLPTGTMVAAVEAVTEALEVPREVAVRLCLRCPSVFQITPGNIADKARALLQHLGLHGMDFEKCMVRHPPVDN
jgi:hypothetical protein